MSSNTMLVPVVIHNSESLMQRNMLAWPGSMTMKILDPVDPLRLLKVKRNLVSKVRDLMMKAYEGEK